MTEYMDKFISDYCSKNDFSGSLRVTHRDKIIYERFIGLADRENNIPIDKNSVFTFYSLSKPFCAIGLLKLRDKGLLDLDCHPKKYLPELDGFDEGLTLRKLLYHTSGLPDFGYTGDFYEKYSADFDPDKIREDILKLKSYPMYFSPGSDTMYANINFLIPALIIENLTGLSYAEYMKNEVFVPLGMKTARVDRMGLEIPNRVKGYEPLNGKMTYTEKTYKWFLGAGDIVGTVDDVYCLNKAIKHRLLLKAETWDEALTTSPISSFGMGCSVHEWHGKRRITHNGGHKGFRTLHIQLPEDDFDIILLSNIGAGDARNDFSEAVYTSHYGSSTQKTEKIEMDKGYI